MNNGHPPVRWIFNEKDLQQKNTIQTIKTTTEN